MNKFLKITSLIIPLILLSTSLKSQSEGSDFCLNNWKVNPIIKQKQQIEIFRNDTIVVTFNYEDGLMTDGIILKNCKNCEYNKERYNYTYDKSGRRLTLKQEGYNNFISDSVKYCYSCIYDVKNRLKNYLVDKYVGGKLEKFKESIYYIKGTDSIRYEGISYSNIYVKKKTSLKENSFLELLLDTLGNVQIKKYYNKGLLTTTQHFKNGEETFKKNNLYNGNTLKMEILESYDDEKEMMMIYSYTEFKYDEKGKLIEEKKFDGNSNLQSVKSISYNEKGFESNIVEGYLTTNEKRIYSYTYKYWEN